MKSNLKHMALGRVAMTEKTVEDIYTGRSSGSERQQLRALCESHERLRAELQGAEILLEQSQKALALTDTGSDEFRKAFPPKCAGDSYFPRESVPGWRVVEKIREVLLG